MFNLIFRTGALLAVLTTGSASWAAQALPAQTSDQSAVTVKATPRKLQGDTWEFDVVFDTHSQALADDLMKDAALIGSDSTRHAPLEWQGDPPGGHHRKGILRFKALSPLPPILELRIERRGEAKPRSFQWVLRRDEHKQTSAPE